LMAKIPMLVIGVDLSIMPKVMMPVIRESMLSTNLEWPCNGPT
jgi:hypothetical protein